MSGAGMTLRLPPAGRLLQIRREARARTDDDLERAALCNARVLAEALTGADGTPVYPTAEDVLDALSFPEMERLLSALSHGTRDVNPNFDAARFAALREG